MCLDLIRLLTAVQDVAGMLLISNVTLIVAMVILFMIYSAVRLIDIFRA